MLVVGLEGPADSARLPVRLPAPVDSEATTVATVRLLVLRRVASRVPSVVLQVVRASLTRIRDTDTTDTSIRTAIEI
jgi:hypothetical protein